jgi:hypothetical protein
VAFHQAIDIALSLPAAVPYLEFGYDVDYKFIFALKRRQPEWESRERHVHPSYFVRVLIKLTSRQALSRVPLPLLVHPRSASLADTIANWFGPNSIYVYRYSSIEYKDQYAKTDPQ